ncbi:helix-turn-helix domain-containing protein [Kitasatospora aureofaciens]|uniref:AraC family transcriptional regulator n=1 Tax=Kitasatospora aureofaciens TaxID=1894 RepID=UPI0033FBE880
MSVLLKDGTMSSALSRVIVDVAADLGIAPPGYAHLSGMAPEYLNDDLYRIPVVSISQVCEQLATIAPWPEVAALLVQRSQQGALGLWDYLITSAPTLLEGIQEAISLLSVVADPGTLVVDVVENGRQVTVSHLCPTGYGYEVSWSRRTYALGLYQRRLSEAACSRLVPVHVTLTAGAPPDHGPLVKMFGTQSIEFEAPTSSITFLAADLQRPSPYAQPGLSTLLRRQVEQNLATAIPLHSWLDTFQASVRALCSQDDLSLAAVAQRMALSPRTLQRRLDKCGTTWTDQVERVRREQVVALLRDTDLSIEAIATRTGYADARALRRAVQRWYGDTPGTLRQALRDAPAAGELNPMPL